MSDPDNFLSRWSRRKLEPSQERDETAAPEKAAEAQPSAVESQVPAPTQDQPQEPPFDPASLPPIESITAGTDIRDFLKPGVPLSLSRAALRRAWTSDPAIRDFIEIAENQWDFTNDSIPGLGPLDPAEAQRLLARFIGLGKDVAETSAGPIESQPEPPQSTPPENAVATREPESERAVTAPAEGQAAPETAAVQTASQRNSENDAVQNKQGDEKLNYSAARHGHGRALPT
jgi:hypothetical protein